MMTVCLFCGCEEEKLATDTAANEKTESKTTEPATQTPPAALKPQPAPQPTSASMVSVKMQTSKGDIVLELDAEKAPVTVKNFIAYTKAGAYDGTIFHRVIPSFMIQGGGFAPDMAQKPTQAPIVNEASNGLKNSRGTIAMARTNNPNSATNQFFINHKDNLSLDYRGAASPGYAVFGKVVSGMDVVDAIAAVPTTMRAGMRDVPAEPVMIKSVTVLD